MRAHDIDDNVDKYDNEYDDYVDDDDVDDDDIDDDDVEDDDVDDDDVQVDNNDDDNDATVRLGLTTTLVLLSWCSA